MCWDKELTQTLVQGGLPWEQARFVVGVIAEQRQIADRQGYERGYEQGYSKGYEKARNCTQIKTDPA